MVILTLESTRKATVSSIVFLAAILLIGANARAAWPGAKGLSRTDSQGPVTVIATYMPPEKPSDEIRVQVRLDTHSVDLSRYRLEESAFIRFDRGEERRSIGATQQGSGHHVAGTLRFAGPVPQGSGEMALIIRNLAGVAVRTLTWKLPSG